ncbi:MAG: discoidin domain-containing protein [Phycisphaeraceae bacterium]|nr:discoidin domain-containing protein [Phycisphaeraceae bacterium]
MATGLTKLVTLDGNASDLSGNGYDGAAQGGITYGPATLGMGSDHNGSDAAIDCGDVPVGQTGAITVAFWVNPRNVGQDWAGYVSKWTLDNGQRTFWIGQHATAGWLRFGIYPTGPTAETFVDSGQVILGDGQWTHIACTYDGNIQRIYADGVEIVASPDRNAAIVDRGGNLRIGIVATGNWFNGLLDDVQVYNEALSGARVLEIMQGISQEKASGAVPANAATDVLRDGILEWTPGKFASTHNLYLGLSAEEVDSATVPTAAALDANSFEPGRLEFGQTYHWRVDEVNGTPDKTVFKGDVWSFTAEPYSIQIPGSTIVATASSQSNEFSTPDKTIDGSGLANGIHGIGPDTMWFTTSVDLDPWIQYEFDSIKKLDTMTVWNSNSSAEMAIGWGIKDVQIEYSVDGESWDALPEVTQLSRGPGLPSYGQNDKIALGGVAAKLVRLNIQSNWGGILMAYSLSEVQFNMIPARAREPMPASGAAAITPNSLVTWRAGRDAGQHTIYVSTDETALADGSAPSASSSTNSLDLSTLALELGKTYYWRVDEVNEAEATSVWAGPVWSFSTPAALTVDEFESYSNDSPNRPFQTWLDGFGYSADEHFPVAYAGNGTGSGAGHDIWSLSSPQFDGQIMEQSIVKSGGQSLPFYYDNTGGAGSEIDRTWSTPQDWTISGVQSLVLNFYGDRDNTGTSLYVKINGETVTYPENEALSDGLWIQWVIDLSSLNTDLQNVTQLTLGVEGIGAGTVYIDAIRLYPNAAEYVLPVEPDASHLVGYYALDGNVRDDSGQGNHGVENGAPIYDAGVTGQAIHLNGIDDFVGLGVPTQWPSGAAPRTLCAWAQTFSIEPGWRIIAGYGSPSGSQACALVMNGTALYASGYGNDMSLANFWDTDEWHHVGLTYDGTTVRMYADGMEVASEDKNWNTVISVARIGRQVNEANEFWDGRVDEVRLYDQVLSLAEMAWLGGKTEPVIKPF